MGADGSFVPRNRLSCHVPAARPVRPAHANSSETKKIICPAHAAHDGHMIGLTPFTACGRSPSLEEGGLWVGKSRVCRTSAGARCAPLQRGGNRNSETHLQCWIASLQPLDAFATVGCNAVPRRGAHCAPVRPRCYNSNFSRGRAKGLRGDRKAPISNRPQNRRFCRARNPMENDCIACGLCGHALR